MVADTMAALGLKVHGLHCWREIRVLPNLVRLLLNKDNFP